MDDWNEKRIDIIGSNGNDWLHYCNNEVLMSIEVNGTDGNSYAFHFYGDKSHLQEWRDAGLNVEVVENVIPHWAGRYARLYAKMQDIFNFKGLI